MLSSQLILDPGPLGHFAAERDVGSFQRLLPPPDFAQHVVDRIDEIADLVFRGPAHAQRKIALLHDMPRDLGNFEDRLRHRFLQPGRHQKRDEQA
jgi:hypothetical protein